VEVDPPRIETAAQRQRKLAAGRDIARQALLGEHPVHGGAGKRLGGEQDVEVRMPRGEGIDECPRAGAQVILGDDERRSPEFPRQLDHVAAAHLEVTELVDARTRGIYVREGCRRQGHEPDHAMHAAALT
jgi:hypothetical protein